MNGSMIDMCQKFHTNNVACLKGCYDHLCQMLRTGQAVLIKIHVFCQDQKDIICSLQNTFVLVIFLKTSEV